MRPPYFLLCLLIFSLIQSAGCASSNLNYFIAIGNPPDGTALQPDSNPRERLRVSNRCTLFLDKAAQAVVTKIGTNSYGENTWTIRLIQNIFENDLLEQVKKCGEKKTLENVSYKWLDTYAFGTANPDQDIERLQEYLLSIRLVEDLAERQPVRADESAKGTEGFEEETDRGLSQWCGDPGASNCSGKKHQLYKVIPVLSTPDAIPQRNELVDALLKRVQSVKDKGDRDTRFFVLGYEIPWDTDRTRIRYGVTFYFEEGKEKGKNYTKFMGHVLLYANEATPEPRLAAKHGGEKEQTHSELKWWERGLYATGYPFALAIGLKNAAFEITKAPFSLVAGLLFGRDQFYLYPVQNFQTAFDAIQVEAGNLPSYSFFPGLYALITELPFVGQLAQLNTGPENLLPNSPDKEGRRKIFLSRGIYGGDKWGQDTGLWVAWASKEYSGYDVYSPAYRHGTATDVVWSMFNLSHGPAYNESKYVMDHAGRADRLYLSGHSGGVQRSTAASRILANHGYSVVKVLGVAGPSIGQAYVDTGYPNSFRIFLNTETGANQDVTSKIGLVARVFSTTLDWAVLAIPKYALGGLVGLRSDEAKQAFYGCVDRLGFSNAIITQVNRKPSTQHHTPFRLSLAESIVFDAYVRTEFATAFREDLELPSSSQACPKYFQELVGHTDQRSDRGSFIWSR